MIRAGAEDAALISGYIIGDEYSYFTTQVAAYMNIASTTQAELASKTVSISISPSPLAVKISREGASVQPDVIYRGDKLSYIITCENTGDISLFGVVVRATLASEALQTQTISGTGYFDDTKKMYTWTGGQILGLKEIKPHTSVSIPFSVTVAQTISASALSAPVIVRAQATSPTVPTSISAKETIGIGQVESKIGGMLGLTQNAYFKEPLSDITNEGSLPPQVGKPIQYTIHWKLSGAGDFDTTIVRATLPAGVIWTGKVKVLGTDAIPLYNERTQEIMWTIPRIAAKDFVSQTPEAVFQISFTPSSQNSGNVFTLISDAALTSIEGLSKKTIQTTARTLTSRQLSDGGLKEGYYRVLPAQP
jgi:hypothetical protein